jgi:large subunit ribosomal protein L32
MAHPKHKHSKTRRDKRRTHDKAEIPTLATCSNCGATVKYHTICGECGQYRGKQVIEKEIAV